MLFAGCIFSLKKKKMLPEGVQIGMAGGLKSIFYMTLKAQILFSYLPFGFAGTKMLFTFY